MYNVECELQDVMSVEKRDICLVCLERGREKLNYQPVSKLPVVSKPYGGFVFP